MRFMVTPKRILHLVDDESTVGDIAKRAPPSLREALNNVLQELVDAAISGICGRRSVSAKIHAKFASPSFKMLLQKQLRHPSGLRIRQQRPKLLRMQQRLLKLLLVPPPSRSMPDHGYATMPRQM